MAHELRVDGILLGQPETVLVARALQLATSASYVSGFTEQERSWLNLLGLRLVDDVPRPTILTDSEGRTRPDDGLRAWTTPAGPLPDAEMVTVACTEHVPRCILTVPRGQLRLDNGRVTFSEPTDG